MIRPPDRHLSEWMHWQLKKGRGRGRRLASFLSRWWLERSHRFAANLLSTVEKAAPFWIAAIVTIGTLKLLAAPMPPRSFIEFGEIFMPYALLALAPLLGLRLASKAYPAGAQRNRLEFHLSQWGNWKRIDEGKASATAAYGPYGLMACLMFGLLLNVPVRAFEFLLAVPAIHGAAPDWARSIFLVMAADVIVMGFLYTACVVMALRAVPLFPRMLLAIWLIDITLQLAIASFAASQPFLPEQVAVALQQLLEGNLFKVFISMFVWLPYLILSDRVNLTYRLRARAI